MREVVTILGIVAIACVASYSLGADAKDIMVGAVSGLVGYLSREVVQR